ncbi:acetate kinase [Photobacterium galatheae]|uniref:Acetate kinase n=1 Tax=Photobacterium galatheae TaxID=1654360 RepID=A0A066RRG2_9GAMM|nr:acetate kinase [Photobacterium galatheae]KDM92959.1 acetate kinase [Photobacterium galatheae]MCM0148513.1 acetate kinase [Photobacterium galatheae]
MSKLVLVLNCGSSSLKFAVVDAVSGDEHLTGLAECLHLPEARIKWKLDGAKHEAQLGNGAAHEEALAFMVETILASKPELAENLKAIGHRVVHGGEQFTQSALIDDAVLKGIESCATLAPLHNPAHIIGIKAAQKAFPSLKNVAVFDTAFHQTMPEEAYLYALPYKLYKEHGIRRYGMHGTSHLFITRETASRMGKPESELNIINCHLGNGASVCAIKNGQSVDTSMGLTPLEGLVMGTRCGDIDPAIIFHLHDTLGYTVDQINTMLTKESGLAGLTEVTSDCRFVEDNYGQKEEATRAMDVFCHRLAKYVASYTATLDGKLDAITFTGGIGENSAPIREMVLNRLKIFGIEVDSEKNLKARFGGEGVITTDNSRIPAMVISTNEELVIAEDTARLAEI